MCYGAAHVCLVCLAGCSVLCEVVLRGHSQPTVALPLHYLSPLAALQGVCLQGCILLFREQAASRQCLSLWTYAPVFNLPDVVGRGVSLQQTLAQTRGRRQTAVLAAARACASVLFAD